MKKNIIDQPCTLTRPVNFKVANHIPEDEYCLFEIFPEKYTIYIYTGRRCDDLNEKPPGRLLCQCVIGRKAKVIDTGYASYFIIKKNEKVVGTGHIGTSGCPLVVSDAFFLKGSEFGWD